MNQRIKLFALAMSLMLHESASAQSGGICQTIDREQYEVNDLFAELRRVYPLTVDFLRNCIKKAKDGGDVAACMVIAGNMASCQYDNWREMCGYSTEDFINRMTTLAARQRTIEERKRQYPGCSFRVPNDLNGF